MVGKWAGTGVSRQAPWVGIMEPQGGEVMY